jgi:hypothetical protein
VYVGYVTKHYPPNLDNGEMTEELFNGRKVAAAVALAAAI